METWKKIMGYPNYEVSDMGNVRNSKFDKVLRPFDRMKYGPELQRGYLTVHLCSNRAIYRYTNFTVHRLVLMTFVGPRPNGNVINHINGVRWDNRLENLEYCTQSYNRKQDFIMGRQSYKGEKNNSAKLTEADVTKIVKMYKTGKYSYRTLAQKYSIHPSGISNIFNGHCWSYLTGITCSANPRKKNTF